MFQIHKISVTASGARDPGDREDILSSNYWLLFAGIIWPGDARVICYHPLMLCSLYKIMHTTHIVNANQVDSAPRDSVVSPRVVSWLQFYFCVMLMTCPSVSTAKFFYMLMAMLCWFLVKTQKILLTNLVLIMQAMDD